MYILDILKNKRGVEALSIVTGLVFFGLQGCANANLVITAPANNATNVPSPVTITVTTGTEIVNSGLNAPATSIVGTIDSSQQVTLTCSNPSTCAAAPPPALAVGRHVLSVNAAVTAPAFSQAPNSGATGVGCSVPNAGSSCEQITTTSTFFVGCSAGGISVSNGSLITAFTLGTSSTYQLAASGGCAPYSWKVLVNGLPPGVSMSASGLLSGTPGQCSKDGFSFDTTVAVSDPLGDSTPTGTKISFMIPCS